MKIISRPVVIESLEWSWSDGWSCSWRRLDVPEGGVVVRPWSLLAVLRRVNWWTEPESPSAGETGEPR